MAAHEYRHVADVVTALGDLPAVSCHGGEVNQVLLNLIVNASELGVGTTFLLRLPIVETVARAAA